MGVDNKAGICQVEMYGHVAWVPGITKDILTTATMTTMTQSPPSLVIKLFLQSGLKLSMGAASQLVVVSQ